MPDKFAVEDKLFTKRRNLHLTELKALADDNLNVYQKLKFAVGRAGNIVERENAVYQHFLLFPQCFLKVSSLGSLKVRIVC